MTKWQDYIAASRGLLMVATSFSDEPSLRMMGFAVDPERENVWYLLTQPTAFKVKQLEQNSKVAIMTPLNEAGMRIESNQVTMVRSDKNWAEIEPLFAEHTAWHHGHPHPETELIYELTFASARLASWRETENIHF